MTERINAIGAIIAAQFKRIDIAMIAAAIVEVPRWYVAFAAIKEPWWAAVPMGILLAWGASAGWKAYFADKRRWLLLAINVTSLAGALIVIAPELYAMTFTPLDDINLALIMSQELLIAWAATLAVTTFIPLVQIAAVKMYSVTPEPAPAEAKRTVKQPSSESVKSVVVESEPATPTVKRKVSKAELARQYNVSRQTIDAWIKKGKITVEQPHLNGATGD